MRVLVAGGVGFVGSHLVDRLLAQGHEVVAIDNLVTGNARNVAHLREHAAFSFVQADVCEGVPAPGRFDRVYNLASPASPIDYLEKPFETLYAGSDGARNLLQRAIDDSARFLQASTSEVYGDPSVHPQVESYWGNVNPIGPRSVYDEAKRFAESLTMAFHRYKHVDTRIARIFNTYGPRMRTEDGRVIPAFCSQAIRGEPLTIFGDGLQTRSLCYVSDLCAGLNALMESDFDEPVNLGNPYEVTMLELARHIRAAASSNAPIVHRPLPQDDPRQRRPDITRAKEKLGWEPKVPFDQGLASTLAYFRSELKNTV